MPLSDDDLLFILKHGLRRFAADRHVSERTIRRRLWRDGTRLSEATAARRVALARELISTELPVSGVAARLCFASPQTFARFFKRHFGISISEARARIDSGEAMSAKAT